MGLIHNCWDGELRWLISHWKREILLVGIEWSNKPKRLLNQCAIRKTYDMSSDRPEKSENYLKILIQAKFNCGYEKPIQAKLWKLELISNL